MNLTTPAEITDEILEVCSEIDPNSKPVFVSVVPAAGARHGYCMTDVPLFAEKNGGSVQFGWIIWQCLKVVLEAEFHACWIDEDNRLLDVVPKPDNETIILFLPDSRRVYQHKPIPNCRKVLVDNDYTRRWLMSGLKKEEIMAKHFKNDEVDAPAAAAKFERWVSLLPPGQPKIGRNDPCPCGSGEKYKRCCGR
jgi:hypothetical protein